MIKMNKIILTTTLVVSFNVGAILGPILITPNTEYRTSQPIIGAIASNIQLDRSDIQATGANTFGDLLGSIPGVEYESGQGNLTALRIRGNEAQHTLLLIDGVKVSISGTQANLDIVPLDQIERIEIVKGPFSALYGPGAIGGVVNIITNKKQTNSNTLAIKYGTHNSQQVTFSSNNSNENNYINISASDYQTDGINANTGGDDDLDGIDRKSLNINSGIKLNKTINIEANFLNTRANIEYDDLFGGVVLPDNYLKQFNVKTIYKFSNTFKSMLDLRKQKTQRREDKYELTGISLLNEYNLNQAKLSFGFENEIDKDIDNARNIKHSDVFAQYQTIILNNDISIGYRNIDHDRFSSHDAYNLGWARNINEDFRLTFAFGKATNLPSHFQNNANITQNQTALRPEHSNSVELGANYKNISAKIYTSKTKNAFSFFDPDGDFLTNNFYYINLGGIENKGIEIDFSTQLINWTINTSFAYGQSIDSTTQLKQGRRPNRTLNIVATRQYNKFNNRIQFITKSKAWDKDNEQGGINAGYGLLNLDTSYHYDHKTKISLDINNIFDKDYTTAKGYQELGRIISLGLSYQF